MNHQTNWRRDPFGIHELRFFSADGKPTLLVKDGDVTSYDKPPSTEFQPSPTEDRSSIDDEQNRQSPMMDVDIRDDRQTPPDSESIGSDEPDGVSQSQGHEPVVNVTYGKSLVESRACTAAGSGPDSDPLVINEPSSPSESEAVIESGPVADARSVGPPPSQLNESVFAPSQVSAELPGAEPMSRALKIAYAVVLGALVASIIGFAFVHLSHSDNMHPKEATPKTTTVVRGTTTTVAIPATLSPTAEAAATALVSSWSTNNRTAAVAVATPAAVATLFEKPYTSGLAINRGCSSTFLPIVCTFGPPGGATPTDPIYEVMVTQIQGGWYVSGVRVEN